MKQHRVMFVCHGNICRSPMAEFVMKDMVKKRGMEDMFCIASSATSTEEIWRGVGNPVYPPAQRELLKHGISCEGKRAVQITPEDYDKYDIILCMDSNNMRNIKRIIPLDPQKKIHRLMSFTSRDRDVADPWYTGDFTTTYNDVLAGCKGLLEYLKNKQ